MEKLSTLFGNRASLPKPTRHTERGDLIEEFYSRLKPHWDEKYGKLTPGYLRWKLAKIPTKDLYYIKSVCNDSKHYAKTFFWLINPKKHEA
jgi:hypothetical protein